MMDTAEAWKDEHKFGLFFHTILFFFHFYITWETHEEERKKNMMHLKKILGFLKEKPNMGSKNTEIKSLGTETAQARGEGL